MNHISDVIRNRVRESPDAGGARWSVVVGGGFAGGYVARLLGRSGATIVSPENFMLYTPMLPEAASGTLEPRHTVVPLRQMCPHAEPRARTRHLTRRGRAPVQVETPDAGARSQSPTSSSCSPWVQSPGRSPSPVSPSMRSASRILPTRSSCATGSCGSSEAADAWVEGGDGDGHLGFVFVGAGYAGVEALAELADLVTDALRWYLAAARRPRGGVLVDAAPKILSEIPTRLGDYAARVLPRGVEIHVGTTLTSYDGREAVLERRAIPARTLVWTGRRQGGFELAVFGMPLEERGRVRVDGFLRVEGRHRVWSLGDCAAVPNKATPGQFDPPTCQHALRQARQLAKNLQGDLTPYRYRDARPGGDARPLLQGDRRRDGGTPPRLPGLVRHAQLPPPAAAALLPQAPRRRRLDDVTLLPPRHRRNLSGLGDPHRLDRCSRLWLLYEDFMPRRRPGSGLAQRLQRGRERLLREGEHALEEIAPRATRSSTVSIVNAAGSSASFTSSQRRGVETGVPGFGRTEQADAIVLPSPFPPSSRSGRRGKPLSTPSSRARDAPVRAHRRRSPENLARLRERMPARDRHENVDPLGTARLGNDRGRAGRVRLINSATWTVSGKPTSGEGSRSKTQSGREGLSTREYHPRRYSPCSPSSGSASLRRSRARSRSAAAEAAGRASTPRTAASGSSPACALGRPSGRRTCRSSRPVTLHRERSVPQVGHEHRRDVAVVREQVALRDPLLRPKELVQVRQLQDAPATLDLTREGRLLPVHLTRRLVLAQTLVDRGA